MIKKLLIILSLIFTLCINHKINAQCSGGVGAGSITPTATWQSTGTGNIDGGKYKNFAGTAGSTYYFSFCIADGGLSSYDTQITILDATGTYVGAGGYNDDFCGLQSYVAWTCLANGTYRVLVNMYSCANQANMGRLMYRFDAPLFCPGGLGTGVTAVASLPYSSGSGTTCGSVDNITATNTSVCGTTFYYGGEDRVWTFTPAITGTVTINLDAPAATYTGLMLYDGCPLNGQGGNCVDFNQGFAGSKTLTVCLQAGVTYYLILDSWPTPICNPYNNLSISAPVPAGACNLGTGQVNVTLPYSSTGRTTCGKVDDLTSINTVTCGSIYYFGAEDEVFVFTPSVSGSITINLTSTSSWVGIMLYNSCPLVSSCSGTPGTCVNNAQGSGGSESLCANVTAGNTYYLVVDQFAAPYCIPTYNISISAPSGAAVGITCGMPVIVASLPYSANNETTACMGNDYSNATTGSCGTLYESGDDKVYRYTATVPECIAITLSAASDNLIGYQVYSGCPGSGGTCIGSNGGATSGTLTGSVTLTSAGTYYIIVDSWAPPAEVSYNIIIQSLGSGASNDLPCNAVNLPIGVYMNGNNNCSGSSGEPAAPGCWVTPNNRNTVWFSFTAPSNQVTIRTVTGSLRNSQMAVYSGICGASMTFIGCDDDAPACGTTPNYMSQLNLTTLTAGTTYYIAVDGYFDLTGSFGIVVIDGPPANLPPVYGQECGVPNPVCNQVITVGDPGYQAFGSSCDFPGGGSNCLLSGERGSAFYEIQIANNGFLTFNIIPSDYPGPFVGDETDYDFALWKMKDGITGTIINTCTSISGGAPPIRCDYSYLGVTGLYGTSTDVAPPAYSPSFDPSYDQRLAVNAGDIYLLVVSNFENSTSGFTLDFGATSPVNYTPNPGYVVWSGGIDNDWFKAPNWGGCAIPSCNIDAVIPPSSANMPVINAAGAFCKSITINPSASLTINSGYSLQLCGNYTNNGSFIGQNNSTVVFNNANIAQSMNGNMVGGSSFYNVTVTKTGSVVNLNQNADMRGTFTISNATSNFDATGKYHRVAGNFLNSGSYISGAGGTLELYGTAAQNYQNSGTINNLTMNHTGAGVTLLTNATLGINGNLLLTNGKIITTPSFEVIVGNRVSSACNIGNTASYVQGFLRRYINATGPYDFPVGHVAAGYQRAQIEFKSATTIDYLKSSFDPYGAVPPGIGGNECGISYTQPALNNGYWTIAASPAANAGSGTYDATLFNLGYSNAASGWTVMRNPGAGWNLVNGTCTACPVTAAKRLSMNGFGTGSSTFGTAQGPSPLPVQLLSFDVYPLERTIFLKWNTASETNSDHFEIQRTTKPPAFVSIAQLPSKGGANIISDYSCEDKNVEFDKEYYYRLKQVDKNGNYDYSKTVSAKLNSESGIFNALPNPYSNEIIISYNLKEEEDVHLEILNELGQIIRVIQNGKQGKGLHQYEFSAKKLGYTAGVYTVRMIKSKTVYSKLIIER
ncbi:MAG: T9SS type A sorting domain-containing protein [Bacteroidia bacterium]